MTDVVNELKKDNNKKYLIIGGIALAVIILIVIIVLVVLNVNKEVPKKKVNNAMETMAVDFYENFYYPNLENGNEQKREEFLKKFEKIGIKVNFDNLSRYNTKENKKLIETVEKYKCDKDNTKVVIKPSAKYGETDYEIEVITDCEFDKKNKKKEEK